MFTSVVMHGWVEACWLHIWRPHDSVMKDSGHWLKTSKEIYTIMLQEFSHQKSIMPTIK